MRCGPRSFEYTCLSGRELAAAEGLEPFWSTGPMRVCLEKKPVLVSCSKSGWGILGHWRQGQTLGQHLTLVHCLLLGRPPPEKWAAYCHTL